MSVEQFRGQRTDDPQPRIAARGGKGGVPRRRRRIERPAIGADRKAAARRLQPHIMAHPDIMDDVAAIAERDHLPRKMMASTFRGLIRTARPAAIPAPP